ncbi:sugar transferase [Parvibaculum sp.]|uniref:sugar transferase n=1 Tax=Parvibaculum sp. TaxID=2024848 RepID=UPI0027303343|nr:sugar transferase [Parvibaculum sp.]MDP1628598.1 sugar transferase [Parvibaculum sp.]MDP2150094.1 sugar transferase [Parvibaculum sp.]MDP3330066.1 sugar transferase [Parvibaculum sp.]
MDNDGAASEMSKSMFEAGPLSVSGVLKSALLKQRTQLLGGVLFAVVLPVLLRFDLLEMPLTSLSLNNTIIGATVAMTVGFFIFGRLASYPGTDGISYSVPVFMLSYGAVLVVFLFLRLDYSRYLFGSSFVLSVVWFTALAIVLTRIRSFRIGIVPGGETDRLPQLKNIIWQTLSEPKLPENRLDAMVADLRADFPPEWERFITETAIVGTPVYHVKQMYETLTGRVEIEHLSENTLGALNPNDVYLKFKRVADWLLAALVIVFGFIFLAAIAIVIRIESKGPVIFRQPRMGYGGKIFTLYKFRTMKMEDDTEGDSRQKAITLNNDARITRFGRFLRRTRIDELPQIINILRGEMSWIGPRPEAVPLSEWYERELPFYRYRHIVRPGISGWAQVMQGHVASTDEVLEKLHYDFYYIKNFSPWLDFLILLKTLRTVITGFGAR